MEHFLLYEGSLTWLVLILVYGLWWFRRQRRIQKWITAYAQHMERRAEMPFAFAVQHAEASLENLNWDLSENPVQAAEEDISCWSE